MTERRLIEKKVNVENESGFQKRAIDPSSPVNEQIWINTTSKQMKTYNGVINQISNSYDESNPPVLTQDLAGLNIDWSLGPVFRKLGLDGVTTFTYSNLEQGKTIHLLVIASIVGTGATVDLPANTKKDPSDSYVLAGGEGLVIELTENNGTVYAKALFKAVIQEWPAGTQGDLTVLNGQTVNIQAGSITDYNNVTIDAGGTLNIDGSSSQNITWLGVKGNLTINGTLRGQYYGNALNVSGTSPKGEAVSYTGSQKTGGKGGDTWFQPNYSPSFSTGGNESNGIGGGGAGGSASVVSGNGPGGLTAICSGKGATGGTGGAGANTSNGVNNAPNGSNGSQLPLTMSATFDFFGGWETVGGYGGGFNVTMGNGGTGWGGLKNGFHPHPVGDGGVGGGSGGGGRCSLFANQVLVSPPSNYAQIGATSGGGGGGGQKGKHGLPLYIYCKGNITGSGLIDVSGTNGFSGGNGGRGSSMFNPYAVVALNGNSNALNKVIAYHSSGGGGGGGGAGGTGGKLWVRHVGTFSVSYAISAGTGGGAGGKGQSIVGADENDAFPFSYPNGLYPSPLYPWPAFPSWELYTNVPRDPSGGNQTGGQAGDIGQVDIQQI